MEGKKVWGSLGRMWKESWISIEVKGELYKKVMIPTEGRSDVCI